MIEFKGNCGHLIRARDEDAGKVVRCSYCGREATVVRPSREGDPEALLGAVEATGVYDALATKAVRKSHRARKRAEKRVASGKPANIDPFAVILKMTYLAIVIVLGAVAWKYVPGLYRELTGTQTAIDRPDDIVEPAASPPPVVVNEPTLTPPANRLGLLVANLGIHPEGAYVSSVPPGGLILQMPGWDLGDAIFTNDESRVQLHCNDAVKLTPGRHTIAVAVRINDPVLMRMTGYADLRRVLESGVSKSEATKRLSAYLLPDDDVTQRMERIGKYTYIVRVYEVEVNKSWVAVTALFLPRVELTELMTYLPAQKMFAFDRGNVERELTFYEVAATDQPLMLDALARVGRISYRRSADAPYRMYQIDPVDGAVTTELLGY